VAPLEAHPSATLIPEAKEIEALGSAAGPKADWREPYLDWLIRGQLPENSTEARRLARCAKSFRVHDGELYHRSHQGVTAVHHPSRRPTTSARHARGGLRASCPRTIVGKAFHQGFY
jgi:hypothetical protein